MPGGLERVSFLYLSIMDKNINLLLEKYDVIKKTLVEVRSHPETTDEQRDTVIIVIRFIQGIINDLKDLTNEQL